MIDVLIVGAGPAGWALASACARRGLTVTVVAPRPHAPWRPTYGMWEDETPCLPPGARWVTAAARAGSRWLDRRYAVLDNDSVRSALTSPEVSTVAARAVALAPHSATLADGRHLTADVVIDATGATGATGTAGSRGLWTTPSHGPEPSDPTDRLESGGPPRARETIFDAAGVTGIATGIATGVRGLWTTRSRRPELSDLDGRVENGGPPRARPAGPFARRSPGRVEQTAFGVFVSPEVAAPLVAPGEAVFMDWRQPAPGPATFLYAVTTPDGRVLLEETSLAARPGLTMATLRDRLFARLESHGITPGEQRERVRFPVDGTPRRHAFGAAAGITHPATGYGVADMIALAPAVADAIECGRPVHQVVWSPQARAVHMLRRRGLAALLALPPHRVPEFFDLFIGLPARHQKAFLSGRADPTGTAHAMATLFRVAPWSLKRHLVAPFR